MLVEIVSRILTEFKSVHAIASGLYKYRVCRWVCREVCVRVFTRAQLEGQMRRNVSIFINIRQRSGRSIVGCFIALHAARTLRGIAAR